MRRILKSNHNLTGKYLNNEKTKVTSSSAIFKTIYHNGSNLLLFGKRKLQI